MSAPVPPAASLPAASPSAHGPAGSVAARVIRSRNLNGSIEHYFHFILGYLAPLVRYLEAHPGPVQIRSAGPLDPLFDELGFADIDRLPTPLHNERLRAVGSAAETLDGYDAPHAYDTTILAELRASVLRRLGAEDVPLSDAVLIVDRGASPAFYQSEAAEKKRSAGMRRSVPNIEAVEEACIGAGHYTNVVRLEEATFAGQVRLFAGTRTLVAQHGAALVNMLWMAPGGHIVEIVPRNIASSHVSRYFSMLAKVCGHTRTAVDQIESHAAVDPAAVVAALARATSA